MVVVVVLVGCLEHCRQGQIDPVLQLLVLLLVVIGGPLLWGLFRW